MTAFGRSADIRVRFVLQDPAHAFERGENIRNCAQRVRHEHSVHALAFEGNALALQCRIKTGLAFDRPICYATGDREWSSGEFRLKPRRRWVHGYSRET